MKKTYYIMLSLCMCISCNNSELKRSEEINIENNILQYRTLKFPFELEKKINKYLRELKEKNIDDFIYIKYREINNYDFYTLYIINDKNFLINNPPMFYEIRNSIYIFLNFGIENFISLKNKENISISVKKMKIGNGIEFNNDQLPKTYIFNKNGDFIDVKYIDVNPL